MQGNGNHRFERQKSAQTSKTKFIPKVPGNDHAHISIVKPNHNPSMIPIIRILIICNCHSPINIICSITIWFCEYISDCLTYCKVSLSKILSSVPQSNQSDLKKKKTLPDLIALKLFIKYGTQHYSEVEFLLSAPLQKDWINPLESKTLWWLLFLNSHVDLLFSKVSCISYLCSPLMKVKTSRCCFIHVNPHDQPHCN